MTSQIIQDKINDIIKKRLINVAQTVRTFLPPVLSSNHLSWSIFTSNKFLLIVFMLDEDKNEYKNL